MKDLIEDIENRLLLKQAECDGLGSELMILQSECIKHRKEVRVLEKRIEELNREAFLTALKHNAVEARLKFCQQYLED